MHRTVGIHPRQGRGVRRAAAHQVETEVADLGAALGIDHHVVGVAASSAHHQRDASLRGATALR
ncbi:hypothetical protein [Hydrogenophaga sp.]|uniref:hypothetical protein n=1 Tax=Hydrogenophaga sp. TaxID=1904254 RepID=UPI0025BE0CEA|nr:hypothetical protein [Hydrogenophaga sp.]